MSQRKFFCCIGNPPYQEDNDANARKKPVYDSMMDACNNIAHKVELITPARFLFDQGQTPKDWNKKMLNDPHFKVIDFQPDSSKVFRNVEIKGGGELLLIMTILASMSLSERSFRFPSFAAS